MAASRDETSPAALNHVSLAIAKAPSSAFLTEAQWRALFAIIDTIIPSVVTDMDGVGNSNRQHIPQKEYDAYFEQMSGRMVKPPAREAFGAYLAERPSEIPAFRDHITRTLASLQPRPRAQLGTILWLLR